MEPLRKTPVVAAPSAESPEKVMVPDEVTPVAAAMAPLELTWNWEEEPTEKMDEGVAVPIPTLPLLRIVKAVVPPLLPTKAWIEGAVKVPLPVVPFRERISVTPVPPITDCPPAIPVERLLVTVLMFLVNPVEKVNGTS